MGADILNFFRDFNWSNFSLQVFLIVAIFQLYKRNKQQKAEQEENNKQQEERNKQQEAVIKVLEKEIANNVYAMMLKQSYRISCLLNKVATNYNSEEERNEVKAYFESDKHGLTVAEAKKLVDKHCPEFPLVP